MEQSIQMSTMNEILIENNPEFNLEDDLPLTNTTDVLKIIPNEDDESNGNPLNFNNFVEKDLHSTELEALSQLIGNVDEICENEFTLDADNAEEYLEYLPFAAPPNATETPNDTADAKQCLISIYQIQCANCDTTFDVKSFEEHICDYDYDKTLIKEEPVEKEEEENDIKLVTELIDETKASACISVTRENNEKLKKIFKDLFKPVPPAKGNSSSTNRENVKINGPHPCHLCDRKFVHASGLTRHLEKHMQDQVPSIVKEEPGNLLPLDVVAKCLVCHRIFANVTDAKNHWHSDHTYIAENVSKEHDMSDDDDEDDENLVDRNKENQQLEIPETDLLLTKSINIDGPFKAIVLNAQLQCEFCDFVFSNVSGLFEHEGTHDPSRGYECRKCSINVSIMSDILIHWQCECTYTTIDKSGQINLRTYYVCNVCCTKFTSAMELYDHRYAKLHFFPRRRHATQTVELNCEKCGSLHAKADSFIQHQEEMHAKKQRKDVTVNNNSTNGPKSSATTSTKYRQYLCDVCGKSYTQSSHLWQHLRFHKGIKPFACQEPNCNRRFTIRPDLSDHIRKCHTGERPYHCLICGKRFLTGSVFYQHRLIHRGERRYGCEECGKRFYRADALKNHQRIHTGEKPYACSQCAKCFRQRGDRDKHERARHGNVPFMLNPNINYTGPIRNDGRIRGRTAFPKKLRIQNKNENAMFLENVPFPKSMFQMQLKDVDRNII